MREGRSMRPQVISVPYRYDRFEEGLGLGPQALLRAGLSEHASAVHVANLADEEQQEDRTAINIGRLGHSTASLVAHAMSTGEPVLVVAGDDTATVGVVSGLQESDGAGRALGIVWFDAHGDFNTPDTSYSGILAGMPLAVIAGLAGPRWREAAELRLPIAGDRILLVGTRELDGAEDELLRAQSVAMVRASEAMQPDPFGDALASLASRCELLYVNIDLDVLDPHLVPSATTPSEGGFDLDELSALLTAVLETGLVAVVSITSLNPLGGVRGQNSTRSAWSLVQTILAAWDRVPPLPTGTA
jgi:arginase